MKFTTDLGDGGNRCVGIPKVTLFSIAFPGRVWVTWYGRA